VENHKNKRKGKNWEKKAVGCRTVPALSQRKATIGQRVVTKKKRRGRRTTLNMRWEITNMDHVIGGKKKLRAHRRRPGQKEAQRTKVTKG